MKEEDRQADAPMVAVDEAVRAGLRAGIQPAVRGVFEPSVAVRSIPLAQVLAAPTQTRSPAPEPKTSAARRWQVPRLALPVTVEPVLRTAGGAPEVAVVPLAHSAEGSEAAPALPALEGAQVQERAHPLREGSAPDAVAERRAVTAALSSGAAPGERSVGAPARHGAGQGASAEQTRPAAGSLRQTPPVEASAMGRRVRAGSPSKAGAAGGQAPSRSGWGDAAPPAPGGFRSPGGRKDTWLEELLHAQAIEAGPGVQRWWLPGAPGVEGKEATRSRGPGQSASQSACRAARVLQNEGGARFRSEGGAREALWVIASGIAPHPGE